SKIAALHTPPKFNHSCMAQNPKSNGPSVGLPACDSVEPIPNTTHRLEIGRPRAIGFDFSADSSNASVHTAGRHELHLTPHRVQKNVTAENPARMQSQIIHKSKLETRSGYLGATHRQLHRTPIDHDICVFVLWARKPRC